MAARKRHDPPSRPADGRRVLDKLSNTDPDRHYVVANPNDEASGVPLYQALGYEPEHIRQDGPRWAGGGGVAEGSIMTRLGGVLMSIPNADRDVITAPEREAADEFERRLKNDGNINDPMRGQHSERGVSLRKATEAEERLLDR